MDILAGKPQTDVPVGNNTQTDSATGWQGMTIKDILDKVDLFNFTMLSDEDEEKLKAAKAELEAPEPVVRKSLRVISDNSKQYFAMLGLPNYNSRLFILGKEAQDLQVRANISILRPKDMEKANNVKPAHWSNG